jgi:hypothetical protein
MRPRLVSACSERLTNSPGSQTRSPRRRSHATGPLLCLKQRCGKPGFIEKSALRLVGGFELECLLLKIFSLDRHRAGTSFVVTKLKAPPKLLDRRIQIMQFHRHAKTSRT